MNNSFINTGLKYCNRFGIIKNVIGFVMCIIYIMYYSFHNMDHIETSARVLSVQSCDLKIENSYSRYGNNSHPYFHCLLDVEYTVNNKKYTNKLYTDDERKYRKGQIISIDYSESNPNNIREHSVSLKYLFYFAVFMLVLLLITTYLRVYHSDNTNMKWFIGITCLRSFDNY